MPWVKDYYGILGCSPHADPVVIRAAWRALLTKYHPDHDPSEEAARKLALVNEAWDVLGSRESRAEYDDSLHAPGALGHRAELQAPAQRLRNPTLRQTIRLPSRRWRGSGAAAILGAATLGTFATAAMLTILYTPEAARDLVDTTWFGRPSAAEASTPGFDMRRMSVLRAELERRQRAAEAAGRPEVVSEGCLYVAGAEATADARDVCPSLGLIAECVDGRGNCRARP